MPSIEKRQSVNPPTWRRLKSSEKGEIRLEKGAAKFGSEGILAPVSASSAAAATHKSAFRQARRVPSWSRGTSPYGVSSSVNYLPGFIACEDISRHLVEFDV
jgi:hypothetical protein